MTFKLLNYYGFPLALCAYKPAIIQTLNGCFPCSKPALYGPGFFNTQTNFLLQMRRGKQAGRWLMYIL